MRYLTHNIGRSYHVVDRGSRRVRPIRHEGGVLPPVGRIDLERATAYYEKRQQKLSEYGGEFSSEGNAIKKAYLSKANIKRIKQDDLLLFYRSHDHREITSLGVCEQIHYGVTEEPNLQDLVGRLSVFTDAEITEMAGTPTTVILFKWHFDLADPIHYQVLLDEDILAGPPQTIQELAEQEYKYIRRAGGIDERFIVN